MRLRAVGAHGRVAGWEVGGWRGGWGEVEGGRGQASRQWGSYLAGQAHEDAAADGEWVCGVRCVRERGGGAGGGLQRRHRRQREETAAKEALREVRWLVLFSAFLLVEVTISPLFRA